MNLVHVSNVVAALLFLMDYPGNLDGEAFIVSDDDSHSNNFSDVEEFLMRALGVPDYNLPRVPVSLCLLAFFLRCLGRNSINPRRNYASDKLIGLGFKRPVSFDAGLVEYATWYRSFHLEKQNRRAV